MVVRWALPLGATVDVADAVLRVCLVTVAVLAARGAGTDGPAAAVRAGLAYGVALAVFPVPRPQLATLLAQQLPGLPATVLARWSQALASGCDVAISGLRRAARWSARPGDARWCPGG